MNALWRASEMFVTRGVRRILVANPMTKPSTISFDGWTLHRDSGELEREGKRVRLQDLPFQILDELLSRPGEVVTREQLIARLWPKTIVDFDTNLNSGVRRLRAALERRRRRAALRRNPAAQGLSLSSVRYPAGT